MENVTKRTVLSIMMEQQEESKLPKQRKRLFCRMNFEYDTENDLSFRAGALDSPKILMNSGIGDASYLDEMGIEVKANNTAIGKNLLTTPTTIITYKAKLNISLDFINTIASGIFSIKSGYVNPLGDLPDVSMHLYTGYLQERLYSQDIVGANVNVASKLAQGRFNELPFLWVEFFMMGTNVTGEVKLWSKNPLDPPKYDYGWTQQSVGPGSYVNSALKTTVEWVRHFFC